MPKLRPGPVSVRGWCRAHWIPYVHGCIWDRECRTEFYLWRIAVIWGQHMWWVDLPGYYKDHDPDMIETRDDGDWMTTRYYWHRSHFGHYVTPEERAAAPRSGAG